jgi:propionyl-CoA carboxylase alpha chain
MQVVREGRLDNLPGRLRPSKGDLATEWVVKIDKNYIPVTIAEGLPDVPVELDLIIGEAEEPVTVTSRWVPGDLLWSGEIGAEALTVQVRPIPNGQELRYRGMSVKTQVLSPRIAKLDQLMPEKAPADTSKVLLCPMPGLIVSIGVSEGQEVKAGEMLAIVEAMKMQNVLRAEKDLKVKAIKGRPGDSMAVDAVIMEFE